MSFKKMSKPKYPKRQWTLAGYPNDGKSTFAAQMEGPILPIDADHRFSEVMDLAKGEVFQLSEKPEDNTVATKVRTALDKGMPGSGVQTIVIDSLTAIISPLVSQAMADNKDKVNTNKMTAHADKAMAMRIMQDAVTKWGVGTLWIFHLRDGRDQSARVQTVTSISTVELTRLRRCINMDLVIVKQENKRGIKVSWCRRGREGMTLWDESGTWRGMPEKIEAACYDGLTEKDQDEIESATPTAFASASGAISWGMTTGIFRDEVHAKASYEKAKGELKKSNPAAGAAEMWTYWIKRCSDKADLINGPDTV